MRDNRKLSKELKGKSPIHKAEYPNEACVICGGTTHIIESFSRDELIQVYNKIVDINEQSVPLFSEYDLLKCDVCSLVFANPMKPGSDAFYELIFSQYPSSRPHRWEWGQIIKDIQVEEGMLLDVGCGNGDFLDLVRLSTNLHVFGIDTSASRVAMCRERGMQAFQQTIDEPVFINSNPQQFSFVTMTHVLEHVANPINTMKSAQSILTSSGKIFVSVPYSPKVMEIIQYDPKNLPPHHLTRWNQVSIEKLADQLCMKVKVVTAPTSSLFKRAVTQTWHTCSKRGKKASKIAMLCNAILYPSFFAKALKQQAKRDIVNGYTAGDIMLAIFENCA